MDVFVFYSRLHGQVELTRERWNHIVSKHTNMAGRLEELREALEDPNIVEESKTDPEACVYYKNIGNNYIVVPIQTVESFVKTGYMARDRKGGKIIWQRQN